MDEFNVQKKSYLEFLWTFYLKSGPCPNIQTGFHSGTQIPRFSNALPDAWEKTDDNGFRLFWFMGCV